MRPKHIIEKAICKSRPPAYTLMGAGLEQAGELADVIVRALEAEGYRILRRELTVTQLWRSLAVTAAFLAIPGSKLVVNREKMRIRFRAIWDSAPGYGGDEDWVTAARGDAKSVARQDLPAHFAAKRPFKIV